MSGDYILQVYVVSVDENPKKIFEQKLHLAKEQHDEMITKKAGTYFDWAPATQNYASHVSPNPKKENELLGIIAKLTNDKK